MKIIFIVIWVIVSIKLFVFWLWLWQLKEYHWGRFKAHFETQAWKKFLFSFHGARYPRLTSKVIVILVCGAIIEFFIIIYSLSLDWLNLFILYIALIILIPLIVSLMVQVFQIPTNFLIKRSLKLAAIKRNKFKNLVVIGITGSYGKTSVKEFLALFLGEKFNVLKTRNHINSEIGIANTILKDLKPEHEILVTEIGAYEVGKIKEVCNMINPQIGILTGINEQHMSTFGSQKNIIKAKNELLNSLPKEGFAISKDNLNLFAESVRIGKESLSFNVRGIGFKADLLGGHNINNILLAIQCAEKLGVPLNKMAEACIEIKPEQGGISFLKKENPTILDASYSSNPDGVIADLEYLSNYRGKKIIIMPCLIELGSSALEVHKRIGKKIAGVCDLAIITTEDYFIEIKQNNNNVILIEDSDKIMDKLRQYCLNTDVILMEGRVPRKLLALLKENYVD
jgi:UDP-N-acetylmuramoyl-tripeptide--D-alanyl-D-alanine ligase